MRVNRYNLDEKLTDNICALAENTKNDRVLIVSDRKIPTHPTNSVVLDMNTFKIHSWCNRINPEEFSVTIFVLGQVSSDFVHAFHRTVFSEVHIFAPASLNISRLCLDSTSFFPTTHRLIYLENGQSAKEACLQYISESRDRNISISTTDRELQVIAERGISSASHDTSTCIVLDVLKNFDYSPFRELVFFNTEDGLTPQSCYHDQNIEMEPFEHISYKMRQGHNSPDVDAFLRIRRRSIGDSHFPHRNSQQILLYLLNECKNTLGEINLFVKEIKLDWTNEGNITRLHLPFFKVSLEDGCFPRKIDRMNEVAYKAIKYFFDTGLVNAKLDVQREELFQLDHIPELLFRAYGTCNQDEIGVARSDFMSRCEDRSRGELLLKGGALSAGKCSETDERRKKFKTRHTVELAADKLGTGDSVRTFTKQSDQLTLIENTYRKIPDCLLRRPDLNSLYLYVFDGSKTGIVCSKAFDSSIPVRTLDEAVSISCHGKLFLSEKQVVLLKFYQLIFFQSFTTVLPASSDRPVGFYYYAVPLVSESNSYDRVEQIDWKYLDEVFSCFLKERLIDLADPPRDRLLWNTSSREFLSYCDDFQGNLEDPLSGGTFCSYFESTYKTQLRFQTGPHIFKGILLKQLASQHRKKYFQCTSGSLKAGAEKSEEKSSSDILAKSMLVCPKEICFLTVVKSSIISESIEFIKLFSLFQTACIVDELNCAFKLNLPSGLLLTALTPESHSSQQNYERLEFLGDTVLKFVVTNFLFLKQYSLNSIVRLKDSLISNESLHGLSMKTGLYRYASPTAFHYRMFQPPVLERIDDFKKYFYSHRLFNSNNLHGYISSLRTEDTPTRNRKFYADVVEAIVGCLFIHGGLPSVVEFMFRIGMLDAKNASDKNTNDSSRCDFQSMSPGSSFCGFSSANLCDLLLGHKFVRQQHFNSKCFSIIEPGAVLAVEGVLNYKFRDTSWLDSAVVHPSSSMNPYDSTQFQLLELIGDSALDIFVAAKLYDRKDCPTPLDMHSLKSSFVNNHSLGSIIVDTPLYRHILVDPAIKPEFIYDDDEKLTRRIPKVFGDIFEALVGAIFADLGWEYDEFVSVIDNGLWKYIQQFQGKVACK